MAEIILPSEQEVLESMKTELLDSDKITAGVIANDELTLTGDALGNDFTITSTLALNDIVSLPPNETEEEILGLIYDQLDDSPKITAGDISNNELTLTGNAAGDDFTITSTIALNPIVLLPPDEEQIINWMKDQLNDNTSEKIKEVTLVESTTLHQYTPLNMANDSTVEFQLFSDPSNHSQYTTFTDRSSNNHQITGSRDDGNVWPVRHSTTESILSSTSIYFLGPIFNSL